MFCLFYQGFVLPQDSTETSEFHSLKSQITPRSVTKETNQQIKTIKRDLSHNQTNGFLVSRFNKIQPTGFCYCRLLFVIYF